MIENNSKILNTFEHDGHECQIIRSKEEVTIAFGDMRWEELYYGYIDGDRYVTNDSSESSAKRSLQTYFYTHYDSFCPGCLEDFYNFYQVRKHMEDNEECCKKARNIDKDITDSFLAGKVCARTFGHNWKRDSMEKVAELQ